MGEGTSKKPFKPNPTRPDKIAIAKRRHTALELRAQGGTLQQVRDNVVKMGLADETYTASHARKDIIAVMGKIAEQSQELAKEEMVTQLEKTDKLYRIAFKQANDNQDLFAIDRCLTILDKRAKLLRLGEPRPEEGKADDPAMDAMAGMVRMLEQARAAYGDTPQPDTEE